MSRGVILYGPPASGKDTVTAALRTLDPTFTLFARLKAGPGRTHGYRMIDDSELERIRHSGEIIWANERYGATYVVDRGALADSLVRGVPVLHLGQVEAIAEVLAATPGTRWTTVSLRCPREVGEARIAARATGDLPARMIAWDRTEPLPNADLVIDTALTTPGEAARLIFAAVSRTHSSDSNRYTQPQPTDAWAAEAAAQGKVGTQRLLVVETVPASDEVRTALRISAGAHVVVRRRLILADEKPVEVAASFYPASIAAGTPLAENKKIRGGAVRILADVGLPLEESIERVTAERPTAEDVVVLNIAADEPLIVIRRVSAPQGREPVEYAVNRMVSSRVTPLEYRMRTD
ncbi:UTRA domain-containing protein [Actinoplanes sp. NPDC051859]|uniref:UTRA domain-containing protein n=1 Tax=Actinoplanes sp. NPDC051859 TaxID=3363909 RepID=UPI0037B4EED1